MSQLVVHNTVLGRLPAPDAAIEPVPPLYYYYLQLRTADGSQLCSFPVILTPQETRRKQRRRRLQLKVVRQS